MIKKTKPKKCKRHKYEGGQECLICGNEKSKGGVPKKYDSITVMEKDIEKYFKDCDDYSYTETKYTGIQDGHQDIVVKRPKPYTVEGLAYALGMSRKGLAAYEKDAKFGNTVRDAKGKILVQKMENGNMGKGSAEFLKFDLKNNYGYVDKIHTDNTNRETQPVDPLDIEDLDPKKS